MFLIRFVGVIEQWSEFGACRYYGKAGKCQNFGIRIRYRKVHPKTGPCSIDFPEVGHDTCLMGDEKPKCNEEVRK